MALSADDRKLDIARALRLMTIAVGDRAYFAVNWFVDHPPFNEIWESTWTELVDYGLVTRGWGNRYALTAEGWYRCIKALGKTDEPEFHQQMQILTGALKAHVNGRARETLVYTQVLAVETGLTLDFIFNAIDARLLEREFNIAGASWAPHSKPGRCILIPNTFGMRSLI